MKIVVNEKMIKIRRRIGQILTISSLVILILGLVLSFQVENNPDFINYSFIALIIGFLLSQIGIYFGNRWGRSPRPDEKLNAALKGLGGQYTLYHYMTAVPHLLVGPSGIWVLIPYSQTGVITYDEKKGRWKHKGGNIYLKLFAQESLGRPDLEVPSFIADIEKNLRKKLGDTPFPQPKAVLVFVNPKVDVQVGESPIPTTTSEKLKDFLRRMAKNDKVQSEAIKVVQSVLPQEGVEQ